MAEVLRGSHRHPQAAVFIGLSLLLHLLLMIALQYGPQLRHTPTISNVEIEFVPIPRARDAEDKRRKQVVETDESEKSNDTTPDAYLGKQTQRVQRQTKAAQVGSYRQGRGKTLTQNLDGANEQAGQKQNAPSLSDIGMKANLKPMGHLSPQQRAATSGATNDYLKEVANGAQTLLNTREYAYFSFYQRVRRQLEQYWEPGLRTRIRAMIYRGRSIAAEKEHSTRLFVILNNEGKITKIQVADTSGVLDLDQAAVEAFNKAGPFPNPPRGMVESDGTVRIEWEFILRT